MKRTKPVTCINVAATIQIDELFLEEDEAFAVIKAVDLGQADVGFTEKVILELIKDLHCEYNAGFDEDFEEIKQNIRVALDRR